MNFKTESQLQRYKVGYYTDEWGMRSNTPCLIADPNGYAVKFEDAEQLTARVRELEEDAETYAKKDQANYKLRQQLAAAQALIEQMREALENHSGNYKLSKAECAKINAILDAAAHRAKKGT